jgi:cytoplasmic tRNA 2-thiolation protein 1
MLVLLVDIGWRRIDIIHSGEAYSKVQQAIQDKMPTPMTCERCGFMSSGKVCKACVLLEGLNRGLPKLGVGKTAQLRRKYALKE